MIAGNTSLAKKHIHYTDTQWVVFVQSRHEYGSLPFQTACNIALAFLAVNSLKLHGNTKLPADALRFAEKMLTLHN